MSKVQDLLADVQDSEIELAKELHKLADEHHAEHDLFHMGHAQAQQCAHRIEQLRPFVERYHGELADTDATEAPQLLEPLRRFAANLTGRSESSGLITLDALRGAYVYAQYNEINWQILVQTLKALRDHEFLEVAEECHERAEIAASWLRTRIKVSAGQVYATAS
jgi:hypothetical protein